MSDSFKSSIASLRVANATPPAATYSKETIALPHSFVAPATPPQSNKGQQSSAASGTEVKGPVEDYEGGYVFAPIKEWQVARAMTKRYGDDLYRTAISDVVIIGAGSAGLSCAYKLAKAVSNHPLDQPSSPAVVERLTDRPCPVPPRSGPS